VSEASANLVYAYEQWEIDLGRRELRSREIPVPLGGRAFEIVTVLVQSATQLVTKDHMMERVWLWRHRRRGYDPRSHLSGPQGAGSGSWFRDAYRKRRCVVPMNSFFQKNSSGKRFAISRRDGGPFGVAGVWENWRNPLTETWERTFAVITVPANELVAPIHDRMLAILQNDQFSRWLSEEADPRDLLVPFPEDQLAIKPQPSRR
jgi:SOS response associated peptidase (SRAP)